MLKTLFRHSENSPLSLFFSHPKASTHSAALLDLSAVLIYSITVTELWKLCQQDILNYNESLDERTVFAHI